MTVAASNRGDKLDDTALVAAILAGDLRAFDLLYARHVDRTYALVGRILGPGADAEDATQDAFIRAFRALPEYRGDAQFSTFLYRIAVRTAIDHARRRRDVPDTDLIETWVPSTVPGADRGQWRHELEQVCALLAELPPARRAALLLVAVEGMSYAEAAELLDSTADAVKHQVMRIRAYLRRSLARPVRPRARSRDD